MTLLTHAHAQSIGASDCTTLFSQFERTATVVESRIALRTAGDAVSISWREYRDRADRLARGLLALGVGVQDTVGLLLTSRPEFHLIDAAALRIAAVPFSLYNTLPLEDIEHITRNAGARVLVTESAFLPLAEEVVKRSQTLEHLVVIDAAPSFGRISLAELEEAGAAAGSQTTLPEVLPEHLATVIYTSGTTGPPKGVELTHHSVITAAGHLAEVSRVPDGANIVSYLPMAHVAERMFTHYLPMLAGSTVTCCPDPRQIFAHALEVRPHCFFMPPRMWEKLGQGMRARIDGEADERRRSLQGAIAVGLAKCRADQAGRRLSADEQLEYDRADGEVLSKLRASIGLDRARVALVGAAPCQPELIEFFHAIGIPLLEGWGLSECGGFGSLNPPERIKIGSVGLPAPGVELRVADDGEVLLRSEMVMSGYRNASADTAEAIDADGWLHTGDVGQIDADGYLTIVDRKKELIINAAGKNMSPANLESKIKAAGPLVGQACVIGDRRPFNVVLLTLDPDAVGSFAREHGIAEDSLAGLAADPAVREEMARSIDAANTRMARVEQIKRFVILPVDWEPAGDELTPTMKLKRKAIAAKYEPEIASLYADQASAGGERA